MSFSSILFLTSHPWPVPAGYQNNLSQVPQTLVHLMPAASCKKCHTSKPSTRGPGACPQHKWVL